MEYKIDENLQLNNIKISLPNDQVNISVLEEIKIENPILDEIPLENSASTHSELVTIKKPQNTIDNIKNIANDQDTMQRMNVSIQVDGFIYTIIFERNRACSIKIKYFILFKRFLSFLMSKQS